MGSAAIGYDRNTLNRKLYASRGSRLQISSRGIYGKEVTDYGTTRPSQDSVISSNHAWVDFRIKYENYFLNKGFFSVGFDLQAVYSTKPLFANYTASVISSPAYEPIPESRTFFIEEFRAHQFAAFGLRTVFEIRNNLEFRLEGYCFQPRRSFIRTDENLAAFSSVPGKAQYIAASALVFNSPLGPISLNLNYYSSRLESPWSFLFNFGYTLFNKSVYDH
jgi:NTE family protein